MNQDKRDNKGGSGKAGTGADNAPNASTTPGATTAAWGQTVPAAPAGNGPIDLPELAQRPSARERLLDLRANMAERDKRETVLINRLTRWLKTMPVSRLAFYSPIRGEPDARAAVTAWLAQDKGRTLALPVVNGDLLEFRVWAPGTPLVPGTYGIPVPQGTPLVQPQVVLIPLPGGGYAALPAGLRRRLLRPHAGGHEGAAGHRGHRVRLRAPAHHRAAAA
jgi:hypothetical protein